ncbi:MAG: hypothetical protein J6S44_03490, partial [Clostridia bacterium]|nr:hypothetical protein [Clostridia bacterium]
HHPHSQREKRVVGQGNGAEHWGDHLRRRAVQGFDTNGKIKGMQPLTAKQKKRKTSGFLEKARFFSFILDFFDQALALRGNLKKPAFCLFGLFWNRMFEFFR